MMNDRLTESSGLTMTPAAEAPVPWGARVWRGLSSFWLVHGLSLLGLAVLVAQWVLPQRPLSLGDDPLAAAAWLQGVTATTAGGRLWRALGLFDVAHSGWIRGLLILWAGVLILHGINSILLAWHTRHLAPPLQWLPGCHTWEVMLPKPVPETAWQEACEDLCGASRCAENQEHEAQEWMCDCHHRWQGARVLLDVGLGLMLVAVLLNLYGGWQVDPVVLDPGQRVSLAPYVDKDVALSEDAQVLTLCCPETRASVAAKGVAEGSIRVWVRRIGQAVDLTLEKEGEPVPIQALEETPRLGSRLVVHFPEARSERAVAAPGVNLAFRLIALEGGGVRVQVLDPQGQTMRSQDVHEAMDIPIQPGVVLHVRPTTYVVLRAQGRPWTWLLWPAVLLWALGVGVHWRWPYCRVAARTHGTGTWVRWQAPARMQPLFQRFLQRINP